MSALESPTVAAPPTADGAPPAIDPLADSPDVDFDLKRFNSKIVIVRTTSKPATLLDPLKATADDLIFDLDINGFPLVDVPAMMMNNGYTGPIFICPKALFNSPGRLTDTGPRPIYASYSFARTQNKTGSTPWERACEIISKHRVPDPRRLDENGQWPRMRPANEAGRVEEVWLQPCDWAKRMFIVGWALENRQDGNRRWFYRNPDVACLIDWVPEKAALPSQSYTPHTGGMRLFVPQSV